MTDEKPEHVAEGYSYNPSVLQHEEQVLDPSDLNQHEIDQAEHHLADIIDDRLDDPNMDPNLINDAEKAMETGDFKHEIALGHMIEEDSPYTEVRATVSNVDDPTMPINTFRAWLLGLITVIVVPGLNQFLYPVSYTHLTLPTE